MSDMESISRTAVIGLVLVFVFRLSIDLVAMWIFHRRDVLANCNRELQEREGSGE